MRKILISLVCLIYTSSMMADGDPTEHPHHISIFGGYSSDFKNDNGFKLGLEYEYRLSHLFGIGGMLDFTGADFEIFAISAGADVFPIKDVSFFLGVAAGAKNEKADKWKPFFRTVTGYDFHVGKFSLGPVVMYDVYNARKNVISFGLGFGIGF
jgi:hypothetical protein